MNLTYVLNVRTFSQFVRVVYIHRFHGYHAVNVHYTEISVLYIGVQYGIEELT